MNLASCLKSIVQALFAFALATAGRCQTYYYSGPVRGYTEVNLTPGGLGYGGFSTAFGTLTETLHYDPVDQTLQEVGSVTISPVSGSFSIFSGPYTYPPESGSATLTIGNDGNFSFDRTTRYDGGFPPTQDLLVPVSGYGSYNGQPFSGSWNVGILMAPTRILQASATSLTFSESDVGGEAHGQGVIPGTDLATGTGDGTYYFHWELDSVVATIPEPNGQSVLGLGLLVLAGGRWWGRLPRAGGLGSAVRRR